MPSRARSQAVRELGGWAATFGDASLDPGSGRLRIRLSGIDAASLRLERRRLLSAWIRRTTDEQQVGCAMTRVQLERQRGQVAATRQWVERTRDRLPPPHPLDTPEIEP